MIEDYNTAASTYFKAGLTRGYKDGYEQGCTDTETSADTFTKSDVVFLVSTFSKSLNELENHINLAKEDVIYFYHMCNPADKQTELSFKNMNAAKSELSHLRKKRNKLAMIQSKLKKLSGNP